MEAEKIVVPLEVDNTELKEALKIAKELNAELEKANSLIDGLTNRNSFYADDFIRMTSDKGVKNNG